MKLNKESIHESRKEKNAQMQITLDRDFNVPDSKPDIDSLIKDKGNVSINQVKSGNGKTIIEGSLSYALLYSGDHRPEKMEGSIDFSEKMNTDEGEDTYYTCSHQLSDLTVKAVNSRKINVKAIITLTLTGEGSIDTLIGADIEEDDHMQMLKKDVSYSNLAANLNDNFRIKEGFNIEASKPEIGEIIWSDADVRGFNTRITEEGINVSGDVNVFIMYSAVDENSSIQWQETTVPFSGKLDINGVTMDMIDYVKYEPVSCVIEPESDYDGENRHINVEMVLSLNVQAYESCQSTVLVDAYSPFEETQVSRSSVQLKKLMMHNNTLCQCSSKIKTGDFGLLQICGCTAEVQVDDESLEDGGIQVYGRVYVNVLYISNDDKMPVGCLKGTIPYEQKIISEGSEYHINYGISNLSAAMSGAGEVEVKASVYMDTVSFTNFMLDGVVDIVSKNDENCEYDNPPGMVGIIAGGDSSLWEIAKKYHTTTQLIRQDNPETAGSIGDEEIVKKGLKLLLVKPSSC